MKDTVKITAKGTIKWKLSRDTYHAMVRYVNLLVAEGPGETEDLAWFTICDLYRAHGAKAFVGEAVTITLKPSWAIALWLSPPTRKAGILGLLIVRSFELIDKRVQS